MRCIVCDSTDKWKNVDEFRLKPSGMCVCENCGFVSYPSRWKSEDEIKKHYRTRRPISVSMCKLRAKESSRLKRKGFRGIAQWHIRTSHAFHMAVA